MILVPRCGERRGHPVVLPWSLVADVASLPVGQGFNALLHRQPPRVAALLVNDSGVTVDLDSPDDLMRWNERRSAGGSVRVRFFALARERAGCSEIDIELAGALRVKDLRAEIARRVPELAPLMKNVMIAVDEEYADDDAPVKPGARIAVIPPVSGGADALLAEITAAMIEITSSPIDHTALTERVRAAHAGAVCTFLGTVRDLTGDRQNRRARV